MNVKINKLGIPKANEKLSERERLLVGMMNLSGRFSDEQIATTFGVSRQTVTDLGGRVNAFLSRFPDGELFSPILLITDDFLEIAILELKTICKASHEDTKEAIRVLFHRNISMDKITAVINKHGEKAKEFNESVDLSGIESFAADEIFKNQHPYLTATDLDTSYVIMMEPVEDRSGETWVASLNPLRNQGFSPNVSVSDAGSGMRYGISHALPDCTMQGDIFHDSWDLGKGVYRFQRHALTLLCDHSDAEYQVFYGKNWVTKTAEKYEKMDQTIDIDLERADQISILYDMFKEQLGFSGYPQEIAKGLLVWTLDEMMKIAIDARCGYLQKAISIVRNRIDRAVSFIGQLYINIEETAAEMCLSPEVFRQLYSQRSVPADSLEYHEIDRSVVELMDGNWSVLPSLKRTLDEIIAKTKRASSLVENLNSRVRLYLDSMRGMSANFCHLVQLSINTKRYRRSRVSSRKKRSPLDLYCGNKSSFLDILIPEWKKYVAA